MDIQLYGSNITVFKYWPYNCRVIIKKLSARESCSLKLLIGKGKTEYEHQTT